MEYFDINIDIISEVDADIIEEIHVTNEEDFNFTALAKETLFKLGEQANLDIMAQLEEFGISDTVSVEEVADIESITDSLRNAIADVKHRPQNIPEDEDIVVTVMLRRFINELKDAYKADFDKIQELLEELTDMEMLPSTRQIIENVTLDFLRESGTTMPDDVLEKLKSTFMPSLYHGTSTANFESIKDAGLVPQVGKFVTWAYASEYISGLKDEEYADIVHSDMSAEDKEEAIDKLWDDIVAEDPDNFEFVYASVAKQIWIASVGAAEYHADKDDKEYPLLFRIPSDTFQYIYEAVNETVAEPNDMVSTESIMSSDIEVMVPTDAARMISSMIDINDATFMPIEEMDVDSYRKEYKLALMRIKSNLDETKIPERHPKIITNIISALIAGTNFTIDYNAVGHDIDKRKGKIIIERAATQVIEWYVNKIQELVSIEQ